MGFNDINIKVSGGSDIISTLKTYTTRILKPNIVDGKNVLTQDMMSTANTKYVIKYDYELGEDITVPANCVLEFDGGSISGGVVNVNLGYVINLPASSKGIVYNYLETEKDYIDFTWFYKNTDSDYSDAMTKALTVAHNRNLPVFVPRGQYQVEMVDIVYDNITIFGCGEESVLYNHTWGNWCFRTSCDYIDISNIKFLAIPHTQVTRTYPGGENDNGASAILAKGSYCTFHDLYIEEYYVGIWVGGDYLDDDHLQHGNQVYNIKCHNINFNTVAWQVDFVAHDITGDCAQFTAESYDGTTEAEFKGNPGHLLYFTGKSYNSTAYNIISFECKGSSSTLAVKNVKGGHIYNITSHKSMVIQSTNCEDVCFDHIYAYDQQKEGANYYVVKIDNSVNCIAEDISFVDRHHPAIFRGSGNENLIIRNFKAEFLGTINGTIHILDLGGSNNTIIENSIIKYDNANINKAYIQVGTNTTIKNVKLPYPGRIHDSNLSTLSIEKEDTLQLGDIGISYVPVYNFRNIGSAPTVGDDRNAVHLNIGPIREVISIDNDKQVTFPNIYKYTKIDKEYIIINKGTISINVRVTDTGSYVVHSNYADYANSPLAAGQAIKLQIVLSDGHLMLNRTNLYNS